MKIRIKIAQDGTVQAETTGFKGPVCLETLTKLLKGAVEVTSSKNKSEFYSAPDKVQLTTGR